jgi:hypothetical protein
MAHNAKPIVFELWSRAGWPGTLRLKRISFGSLVFT